MVTPTHAEDPLHNIRAALARDREDEALAIAARLPEPDLFNDQHDTALSLAVGHGSMRLLEASLKAGANPDFSPDPPEVMTPIWQAATRLWWAGVQRLLAAGADAHQTRTGDNRFTLAEHARAHGEAALAASLAAKGVRCNPAWTLCAGLSGTSPEFQAQLDALFEELAASLRPAPDCPLLADAIWFRKPQWAERLLALGFSANGSADSHISPLMAATDRREVELIRVLLQAGASVDQRDSKGRDVLFVAATRRLWDVIPLLLDKGANPDAMPPGHPSGSSMMELCSHADTPLDLIERMLAAGAEPDAPGVMVAATFKHRWDIVDSLLSRGASIDRPNAHGVTALQVRVGRADAQGVEGLLARGASPTAPAANGDTALGMARNNGPAAIADLLVAASSLQGR